MKTKIAVNAACGKMGQQVITYISTHGEAVLVSAFCRPGHDLIGQTVGTGEIHYSSDIEAESGSADVIIDFSVPAASITLIDCLVRTQTPVLIGTTGFVPTQQTLIEKAAESIPVLLAPNTSIGVNSTLALLKVAAKMFGQDADIEIIESHHHHKLDAPSGTAIRMGESLAQTLGKKLEDIKVTESRFENRIRNKGEIGISSIRAGNIVGDHKVIFALENEVISIEHKALNRACFVQGAVAAAIWLATQKPGLYSMQDFLAG